MAQVLRPRFLLTTLRQSRTSKASPITASVIQLRSIWSSRCLSAKVDTKTLANLRKETGYGISLCREALVENENDLQAAHKWLRQEATKRGLKKAEKLQQRTAGEGLIGVVVEGKHAAMVEVCCETDFVAQNSFFQHLVAKATITALQHRKMIVQRGLDLGGSMTHFREVLLTHKLKEMKIPQSRETVNDILLQVIGRLGERIALGRAITMTTDDTSVMGCYTHGPFTQNIDGCMMGRYVAVVATQPKDVNGDTEGLPSLTARLSQHVVGMNPTLLSSDEGLDADVHKSDVLIEQQYLMDESITVKELLDTNNAVVVDFLRMECASK